MDICVEPLADVTAERYTQNRTTHWEGIARGMDRKCGCGAAYHGRLADTYKFLIPPNQRVLEIGCGDGRLLAQLRPAYGLGVDFSAEMIARGRRLHPELVFIHADAHSLDLDETFDFIILSDLINELWDVQAVLKQLHRYAGPGTRIILNTFSHLWALPLWLAANCRVIAPRLRQNWLTVADVSNLLYLSGFEMIRTWPEVLWPFRTPLVQGLCNRFLVKLFPIKHLALTNFIIARPACELRPRQEEPTVSVIVPARNEAGNIDRLLEQVPELGSETELIFVEGHSTDNTYEAIEKAIADHPERRCRLLRQTGTGKGDAVRNGFERALGDILVILDADLSVSPEDLVRFYEAIRDGKGEFINGVRLVYPMENRAMRFANFIGNKFFSLAFSWLLGFPLKDTLCGTKVLWRRDYQVIAANRTYFGNFDPFGDFDLLFGAAKLNLKIVDMPVRYRERTYGTTNIRRWKHGWMLFKMVLFAGRHIKFV